MAGIREDETLNSSSRGWWRSHEKRSLVCCCCSCKPGSDFPVNGHLLSILRYVIYPLISVYRWRRCLPAPTFNFSYIRCKISWITVNWRLPSSDSAVSSKNWWCSTLFHSRRGRRGCSALQIEVCEFASSVRDYRYLALWNCWSSCSLSCSSSTCDFLG